MRSFAVLLGLAALLAPPSVAETPTSATDLRDNPFSVSFPAGSRLDLRVRSGEVRVVGVPENRIAVEISGRNAERARDLKVRFERSGDGGKLRISGGPKNDLTITIRIPEKTELRARVPYGEVTVENVFGSKDVELHAGDLTVELGDRDSYARVDASVYSGEVDASPFGESHGGLFRSFHHAGNGSLRLHAHVGAGQITLR